jgi:lysophospholipase L1-like esterase
MRTLSRSLERRIAARDAAPRAAALMLSLAAGVASAQAAPAAETVPGATALRIPAGSHYVAMGSSYAAGPGITTVEPGTPPRCSRSVDNYAHQLARRRGLVLTDAGCSGARTVHVLEAWDELPAQLDALRPETRLVTVTIGGNDLGYMQVLGGGACRGLGLKESGPGRPCPDVRAPADAEYDGVATRMRAIAAAVRARSPQAQLVFVDYVSVLPPDGTCELAPLGQADAALARQVDARLRAITATAARDAGALLLEASRLTRDHHACAADAWVHGFPRPDPQVPPVVVFHPKLPAMTAIAGALDSMLPR